MFKKRLALFNTIQNIAQMTIFTNKTAQNIPKNFSIVSKKMCDYGGYTNTQLRPLSQTSKLLNNSENPASPRSYSDYYFYRTEEIEFYKTTTPNIWSHNSKKNEIDLT